VVENQKKQKTGKDGHSSGNYPEIKYSPNSRLQGFVKVSDLQGLVLYLLAEGGAPQWVAVRHHKSFQRVVVLMVPGLEEGMFNGRIDLSEPLPPRSGHDETSSGDQQDDVADSGKESPSKSSTPGQRSYGQTPDDYYPRKLDSEQLAPPLQPLADIFSYLWPVKSPGDDKYSRIYSPIYAMLNAPLEKSKSAETTKGSKALQSKDWKNEPIRVTQLIASLDDLLDNQYDIHPAMYSNGETRQEGLEKRQRDKTTEADGWRDTRVSSIEEGEVPENEIQSGSRTAGRDVISIDCEMCKTEGLVSELTRISVLAWDGTVLMDELVKPKNPVVDYLTRFSGITKEKLDPVETTLADIQERLLKLITPRTILVGHSLESDLKALKMTHPFVVDTSIIFAHPRGPPLKSSLKYLAQRYLNREIQKNHGSTGHDSIEDARTCLDLVKQKCEKGINWGMSGTSTEPIFRRIGRFPKICTSSKESTSKATDSRTTASVDWDDPRHGPRAHADVAIGCQSDPEVVEGIKRALLGDSNADTTSLASHEADFVWARLRGLEIFRGWGKAYTSGNASGNTNSTAKNPDNDTRSNEPDGSGDAVASLAAAVTRTVGYVADIYASLPPQSALIVFSGTGDTREVFRLINLQQQFKREYQTRKWDQLTVRWTDAEEQALRKACKLAREGIALITVK
jgi:RNA exonuclease 1